MLGSLKWDSVLGNITVNPEQILEKINTIEQLSGYRKK